MPRRDGTGPMGAGPMTGRGRGICPGHRAKQDRPDRGFGFGRRAAGRRGLGRGFRRRGLVLCRKKSMALKIANKKMSICPYEM